MWAGEHSIYPPVTMPLIAWPMVTDHGRHRTIAQDRDHSECIPPQVEHAKSVHITIIRAVPPGGAPVAPLVGSNDVKPGRGQGQHNLAPAIGQLREALEGCFYQ